MTRRWLVLLTITLWFVLLRTG